jgi:NAD(P)-dependent dehydrogenase (short-subunit alcohol dehydrogenase family)
LHEEGPGVLITGRNTKTLDAAVSAIGAGTLAMQSDVSKVQDIDRLFSVVGSKLGKITVLFANAGIVKFAPYTASPETLFDELFATNVKGVYFTLQKAIPLLNDGASVIFNTSVVASKGTENVGVYAASKAAVRSFGRTAATELQSRRIRVNAVAPGAIATPIFGRAGLTEEQIEGFKAGISTLVPMRRIGSPKEVASAVAFLASDDASYITGIELNVDGGMANLWLAANVASTICSDRGDEAGRTASRTTITVCPECVLPQSAYRIATVAAPGVESAPVKSRRAARCALATPLRIGFEHLNRVCHPLCSRLLRSTL